MTKLSDPQLNKLKYAVKNLTGVTLRINIKVLQRNNLPYELLLTIRQTTKPRNAFGNNMSAGKKLSETQLSKINQSGGFLRGLLSKIGDLLMKVVVRKKYFSTIRNNNSSFSNW